MKIYKSTSKYKYEKHKLGVIATVSSNNSEVRVSAQEVMGVSNDLEFR